MTASVYLETFGCQMNVADSERADVRLQAAGFEFSDAMKKSGIVWDDATMADYNRDPKGKVPGTKMVFNGVKNAGQLADLVAYLKEATK